MLWFFGYLLLALAAPIQAAPAGLTNDDIREIRANLEAYRTAWLRADDAAVLATFADAAVIMPHHGGTPSAGLPAIRAYWFSPGPKTAITAFEMTIDEVDGAGNLAFVRGHSIVRWSVEQPGGLERWSNAGTFLNVMVKRDGRWKTRVQMWDDPPNKREVADGR